MAKKETNVINEDIAKGPAIDSVEIGTPEPIEKVSETDFVKAAELEAFMNQVLTIIVHHSNRENAQKVPSPGVNGIHNPIIPGVKTKVKRKYVEALARDRTIQYNQIFPNVRHPDRYVMQPVPILSHQFTVLDDPDPRGPAWLRSIMEQPV